MLFLVFLVKVPNFNFKGEFIKFKFSIGKWLDRVMIKFKQKSGGKNTFNFKVIGSSVGGLVFILGLLMSWFAPKEDRTTYRRASGTQKTEAAIEKEKLSARGPFTGLFKSGQNQKEVNEKKAAEDKQKKIAIRYFAPQVLGNHLKGPKAMLSGTKLIGVLLSSIDTRAQNLVRVRIAQGGELGGINIEKDSILQGKYSYQGTGEKVYLKFTRIDLPDGDSKKIAAQALNANDYTPGITGEEFTGSHVKIATSIGLEMFAGMTDTLTDRMTLGINTNEVQARPTMKNALLQGMSRASKEQADRVASTINEEPGYVIISEGKEIIIELTEDFKNETPRIQTGY
jgi:hypothetical protein